MGDFNQRLPRRRQPEPVYSALMQAIGSKFVVHTQGTIAPVEMQSIDHIATTDHFRPMDCRSLSNVAPDGTLVSDHFGVTATLAWNEKE
jgi:endonuclease/exonuclease/phosphatase family metal-dependent hydrolase